MESKEVSRSRIDIHADDYGLSGHVSEDILKCLYAEKLDSISVLTNMKCLEEYAEKFNREKNRWSRMPLLSVHLNFMEGHCLAPVETVSHLVDERGYFKIGWGTLFLWNYCPWKYKEIERELAAEIEAQTECFREHFGEDYGIGVPLRFDGHQHTQMIPIVYKALMKVMEKRQYLVDYIRVTKEPIRPFLMSFSLWKSYRPVNIIKNLLLNFYSIHMEKIIKREGINVRPMFLWGVLFSGHMDAKRVGRVLPLMKEQAYKKDRMLEILFHPGSTLQEEMGEEFSNDGSREFYLSKGRRMEYEAIMVLNMENLQSYK
ncbi:ChbG/HpnK family deacetylase [Kineothrix sedimenti]|uniref:ChbG/HpnK family deacetylase n=1 Tax=Kineothrix sedimenti TaxID=3123317 RepID=A0ABZ3EVP0_9FIRM